MAREIEIQADAEDNNYTIKCDTTSESITLNASELYELSYKIRESLHFGKLRFSQRIKIIFKLFMS